MNKIEGEVKRINNLAAIMRTSYSQISTDWVLDINCYSTNMPDANLEFDMKKGLITGKLCVPCDVPGTLSNNMISNNSILINDNNKNVFDSFRIKHSASLLSTFSLSFPGLLDIQKLRSYLDDILFGNGSRVGGGYRQPSITYVNLLDKSEIAEEKLKEASGRGNNDGNIMVYSSAPQIISTENISDSQLSSGSGSHSMDTDEMKIFRMKGVLHVKDEIYLQILQGVFDIFEVKPSSFLRCSDGDKSAGLNRIVVIGRNIDRDIIEEGFLSCIV